MGQGGRNERQIARYFPIMVAGSGDDRVRVDRKRCVIRRREDHSFAGTEGTAAGFRSALQLQQAPGRIHPARLPGCGWLGGRGGAPGLPSSPVRPLALGDDGLHGGCRFDEASHRARRRAWGGWGPVDPRHACGPPSWETARPMVSPSSRGRRHRRRRRQAATITDSRQRILSRSQHGSGPGPAWVAGDNGCTK